MSKCLNCKIELQDPADVCPLCKCIVEMEEDEVIEPSYPHAEKERRKIQLALNVYTFLAIVAEVVLIGMNVAMGNSLWWSAMIGGFLVYGFITLKFSIQGHTGYQSKMLLQSLLALLLLILIDVLTGFHGWSLNYIFPVAFVLIDAVILILMIVNSRNWQSYIPMQILIIVFCIIPFVLRHFGITEDTILSAISFAVALLVFVGTLIVGGKRARDELYRRFHV